jgi:hypothetical protein
VGAARGLHRVPRGDMKAPTAAMAAGAFLLL